MKHRMIFASLLVAGSVSVAPALFAHHSHAMFDHTKEVTVVGTVTEFVYRNPHVFLYLDVKEEKGETVNYSVEMSNIPNMIRLGIMQATITAGDKVSVNVHPLRDGRPGGNYVTVVAADGKTYQ